MEELHISDCTRERLDELKETLYGAQLNDDTFLYMLSEEILEE